MRTLVRSTRFEMTTLAVSPLPVVVLLSLVVLDFRIWSTRMNVLPAASLSNTLQVALWNFSTMIGVFVIAVSTSWTFGHDAEEGTLCRSIFRSKGIAGMLVSKTLSVFLCSLLGFLLTWVDLVVALRLVSHHPTTDPGGSFGSSVSGVVCLAGVTVLLSASFGLAFRNWVGPSVAVSLVFMIPNWLMSDSWARFTPTRAIAAIARLGPDFEDRLYVGTAPPGGAVAGFSSRAVVILVFAVCVVVMFRAVRAVTAK